VKDDVEAKVMKEESAVVSLMMMFGWMM